MPLKKLSNLVTKEKGWNFIILSVLATALCLYIAGVVEKVNDEEDLKDSVIDLLKVFLVWTNVLLLTLLLIQKKVLSFGNVVMKAVFIGGIILLHGAVAVNLSIIIKQIMYEDEPEANYLTFNQDFFTMGITLATDVLYLTLYGLFKSTRAILITVVLIVTEIIVIGVCSNLGEDIAVDVANFTISLITTLLGVLLWSAKVVLNDNGHPSEFKDYFERDDLEDMEVMITLDRRQPV